ncbi:putative oxidoreductase (fatty acid repression mutant protein) [Parabacteroides sp. PF5-5]|uniref:nitroreductase family protein n=1 Tax=unclassified Parabacteroides TaxID=2649774 RepID=UPI00247592D3|nr:MULTISPECIES: nitroreductase family protein [unclassified Parabacteroides]MDH6303750.1 putative oxidoreductase (fatty acid repression mutant protein) [Parabacteroides sp. PH5-39]MDH6314367.1 putative oxidoreductase (fatty acid repression mutant protein) [Parabacteroides sp. PF5-13]MDH6318568.1 putative oxidoreductase (fatty acid repression mutant protein) [Parabacteroides sp. PH5-13]MDH6322139.1 putative oxidoreductase (fatty acid repression mutant protein) [Parabacteroides sp. PH5-8]MDH632
MKNWMKAIENRRSYYSINDKSPISDKEIKELIDFAVLHVPSAFNSQTARVVLLLNDHHKKLWNIVKEALRSHVPAEAFHETEAKIDNTFGAGHGTVLFFEDESVVEGLQKAFPSYSQNFPVWSQHTSAMHQFAIWTLLEANGFGASLQHYNPLIDAEVAKAWNINSKWKLVAQMPFGTPVNEPGPKEFQPLENRSIVFE